MCNTYLNETFFELLQVAVGRRNQLSSVPSAEKWYMLLDIARKQAVIGICRIALERLPQSQWPPQMVTLKWSAICRKIEQRNRKLNKAAVAVFKWFGHRGLRSCMLKGQGNAMMYPDPMARTPGDIDIWIDAGSSETITFARRCGISGKACYHHIEWRPYGDVEVELHYRPSFMFSPLHNFRLQKWFHANSDAQFTNSVELPGGSGTVAMPTFGFNAVFQLAHLSNHFFNEGIGLKQFADYYFLLMANKDTLGDEMYRNSLENTLRYLGLHKFAGAVMWVLGRVFLLERDCMVTCPDKRRGEMLLEEIAEGGNFGKYDRRSLSGVQATSLRHNMARLYRDIRLCHLFPLECLWEPAFRLWHSAWRLLH